MTERFRIIGHKINFLCGKFMNVLPSFINEFLFCPVASSAH